MSKYDEILKSQLTSTVLDQKSRISFTRGAAALLASYAVERLGSKQQERIELVVSKAEDSLPELISRIAQTPYALDGRITKNEVRKLKREELICGVSPWC